MRARDPRCTAPGCRAPAYRCDLDHVVAWPQGPTCACNLHPLCRRHHRVKHEAGWVPKRHPDGSTTWTTTNGVEVTSPAQAVLATPSVVAPPEQPAAGAERDDPGVDPDPDLAADPEPYRLRALRARMARRARRRGDLGPPPF